VIPGGQAIELTTIQAKLHQSNQAIGRYLTANWTTLVMAGNALGHW
jgi:hypothetical protein